MITSKWIKCPLLLYESLIKKILYSLTNFSIVMLNSFEFKFIRNYKLSEIKFKFI